MFYWMNSIKPIFLCLIIENGYLMSVLIQNINYQFPDGKVLFTDISASIQAGSKVALIGNNGCGKSTLFRLISDNSLLNAGSILLSESPYLVPQNMNAYLDLRIGDILMVSKKIEALHKILAGELDEKLYEILSDDWLVEEQAQAQLNYWGLSQIGLMNKLSDLSGGERVKVFLAGLTLNSPAIVLMDEPTNHLDYNSKQKLYNWLAQTSSTVVIISHDRELLNAITHTYELSSLGLKYYSGNYDSYKEQKEIELNAIYSSLKNKENEQKQAALKQQKMVEQRQKSESRGKKLSAKKGIGKMAMDTRQDRAEKTSSKFQSTHQNIIGGLSDEIRKLKSEIAQNTTLKLQLDSSGLPMNKLLIEAKAINSSFVEGKPIWRQPIDFSLWSGERILLSGDNGSGKTSLLKLIIGELPVVDGELKLSPMKWLYLDQDYSMLDEDKTVYEQAQFFNSKMPEHEVKCMLHRAQLDESFWDRKCESLSGGEKMKLCLCNLLITSTAPDLLILDEPTNNIDINSMEILSESLSTYQGALIIVSHDSAFVNSVAISREFCI